MSVRPSDRKSGDCPDPEAVARLHAAGESRNSVARTLGVSTRQVDNVARELGLSWAGSLTREAVEAKRLAAEVERLELAGRFRRLAVESVELALVEEDPLDRRRHTMTASTAAQSDLAIWARKVQGEHVEDTGGEVFEELLNAIRGTPVEVMGNDGETIGAYRSMEDMLGTVPEEWEAEVDRSVSGVEGDRPP